MIEFFRGAITTRQKIQNPRALMVSLIPSCLYVVLKVFFLGWGGIFSFHLDVMCV